MRQSQHSHPPAFQLLAPDAILALVTAGAHAQGRVLGALERGCGDGGAGTMRDPSLMSVCTRLACAQP
eukprot:6204615-Pleurochrysis_carterae.AAC.3